MRQHDDPEEGRIHQERRERRALLGLVLILTGLGVVFAPFLGDPPTQKMVGIPLITFGALIIDAGLARSVLRIGRNGNGHH